MSNKLLPQDGQIQRVLNKPGEPAWKQYAHLAVGRPSRWALLRYEFLTGCFGNWPGAAGYWLRRKTYGRLFASMGAGAIIGRNVVIRGADRIRLGRGVAIDDNVVLDARDADGAIEIGDGALISRNTIVRARNGMIKIGEKADIGANCLLATDSRLEVGRQVLIAAYTYVCAGGNHICSRTDVPILEQGLAQKDGIVIEDDVWLGAYTMVLDGVRIGTGTVIGAHSLVNKSLPARSLAWGQPARRRKERGATATT